MEPSLTAAQCEQYRSTGLACPIAVLEPKEAEHYRESYSEVAAAFGGAPKAVQMSQIHRFYGWAWQLASHPRVLDAVEAVLGPDILLWSASVFPKPAFDPGYVTMHQDGTYWGLQGGEVTTAWVALTDSTTENGCMRLLPGSHLLEIQPHRDSFAADNLLTRGQEIQFDYDERNVVDIELLAGEMSLHHLRAIHGSRPNGSDRPRIGFAARFVTPQAKPLLPGQTAALVRGRDRCGNWDLDNDPPDFPSQASAVLAHQAEAAKFVAALTRD